MLSFAQERLWFLEQLDPGTATHNIAAALRFSGPLSLDALEAGLGEVVRRQESLRTVFFSGPEGPYQVVLPAAGLPLPWVDLSELAPAEARLESARLAAAEARRPFDLSTGPLLRTALLHLGAGEHVLVLTMHHIVADGWSAGVMVREIGALYAAALEGRAAGLPELPIQYRDFVLWQRERLTGEAVEAPLAYWRGRLAGIEPLALPTDRPRAPVRSAAGAQRGLRWPQELTEGLEALSERHGVTLFVVLLAGWSALLSRYSGQDNVAVASPVANRSRSEMEEVIGLFVNTVVLRTELPGEPTFAGLLERVRDTVSGAFEHQELPFERLVQELEPERSLSRTPLAQVMLVLQGRALDLSLPGLGVQFEELDTGTAKFDLLASLTRRPEGLAGFVEHSTDLFDGATVDRLAAHWQRLLEEAVAAPHRPVRDLPILAESERRQLLVEWSGSQETRLDEGGTLHGPFDAQAERVPDAVSVVDDELHLTYRELQRRANRVASLLRSMRVEPESLVAVCQERTPDMLASMLGILKAGGAYVPLDPSHPQARRDHIVSETAAPVILAQSSLRDRLPGAARTVCVDAHDWDSTPAASPGRDVVPGSLAYVMYTSGSTGTPKGVAVRHPAAAGLMAWGRRAFTAAELKGVLASTSIGFDISVLELFLPLSSGGTVILAENVLALPDLPARAAVTLVNTVPSAMAELVGQGGVPPSVLTVSLAGEALRGELVERVYGRTGARRVLNLYGPTEDTIYSTWTQVTAGARREPSIGRAVTGSAVYVLDRGLRPVPIGVAGELCLGGGKLARGYLRRPEWTAERFVPDPHGALLGVVGGRLYRTGDLASWRPDGTLEFLGRLDHQVKVRGFRIELGEVEAVLLSQPAVREAVVMAREVAGAPALVAYLVAGQALTISELRRHLRERLPEYMIPAVFLELERLPLNTNGKVDRRRLPAPRPTDLERREQAAPATPVEELLAAIWAEVLELGEVGARDNFFELGGHSLRAVRVRSRVQEVFGVDLPVRALFEAPTVGELAARIETARHAGPGRHLPALRPTDRSGPLPLSFSQQRLWFLDQLSPDNPFYNMYSLLRLEGDLDPGALEWAFAEIVRRHEVLRTTFEMRGGEPWQVVRAPGFALPRVDLGGLPDERRRREAERLSAAEARRPFDLATALPLRATLVWLAPRESYLLLNIHHVVCDGWSLGILQRELVTLYCAAAARRPSPLPELPLQFGDYAVWQRRWLEGEELSGLLSYWRERLAGAPSTLELPADRVRPAIESFRGTELSGELDAGLAEGLRRLGRRFGATPFMTALAVFKVLLWRYVGRSDIVVGTAVANRNQRQIEDLIGFFVNTLVLRTSLAQASAFAEVLGRVREVVLEAYSHQEMPFEKLVDELVVERSLSGNPLCQVLLVFQNFPLQLEETEGLRIVPLEGAIDTGTAKFDLIFFLWDGPGGTLECKLQYNSDLFDRTTMQRLFGHYEALLGQVVRDATVALPALGLLAPAERHQILREWNGSGDRFAAGRPLHRRFESVAAARPAETALTLGELRLTYGELDRLSNRLARRLRRHGVGPEVLVGLAMERSLELVVSVLGILKAGGGYVPLDPAYPKERLAWLREDSACPVLLTQTHLASRFTSSGVAVLCVDGDWGALAAESDAGLEAGAVPDNVAYVIYTSGSTGRPKGVQVTHRNVARLFESTDASFGLGPDDVWTLFHSFAFDFSVWEIWGALLYGGRLVVVPYEVSRSPQAFYELLVSERVTVLSQTPSAFRQLIQAEGAPRGLSLRYVVFGGEALDFEGLRPWFDRHGDARPRLINMYGITETTVHVTYRRVVGEDLKRDPLEARDGEVRGSRIGQPLADLEVYLVDDALQPVAMGVAGEILVGGEGTARGYLGRPDLTAARFVPDPWSGRPGARLYRSGDLGRYLAYGELAHLGRIDHQVKVRGFRIELGEIESVLSQHPMVREATVVAHGEAEDRRLVAYVVRDPDYQGEEDQADASEQVEHWEAVFDGTYGREAVADPTFDISGWDSSYTGEPIPAGEMREWVERTVERILALSPRRVLEIGSGTGLLLYRISPRASSYVAWDFSARAVANVKRHLGRLGLSQVHLEQRAAHDFTGVTPGSVDAVLLNSVAQYFPSIEYLLEVVEKAVAAIAPGGFLFVGDLRSLPLAVPFYASVELARAPETMTLAQLRQRVDWQRRQDEELLVDPSFFLALERHLPGVGWVEVLPKRARHLNELSRFRYDVVLHVGPRPAGVPEVRWLDWEEAGLDLEALASLAAGTEAAIGLRRVPNGRLGPEVALLRELAEGEDETPAAELRRRIEGARAGVDPEALWGVADRLERQLLLDWGEPGPEGRFDGVLLPRGAVGPVRVDWPRGAGSRPLPWRAYANRPLQARLARRWLPQLQAFVRERLPEYMVPSAYVLLESLPLTAHGKVDRRALPAPDMARPELAGGYEAPRTPLESALEEVWRDVLGLERVGIHDGFFELGGDSIKVVRLVSQVNTKLTAGLTVQDAFRYQSIAEVASYLESSGAEEGPRAERLAGLQQILDLQASIIADDRQRPLLPVPYDDFYPLSGVERGMIYHSLLVPEEPVYYDQVTYVFELRDLDRFYKAFELLVDRHPILRSRFYMHDFREPLKVVAPIVPVERDVEDLARLPRPGKRRRIDEYRDEDQRRRLAFTGDLLWRLKLFRLEGDAFCVVWSWHHSMLDGWSNISLWVELNELYGRPDLPALDRLPRLASDYKDYVAVTLVRTRSPQTEEFWRGLLAGAGRNKLPFNRSKVRESGISSGRCLRRLSDGFVDSLRALAAELSVSLQALCLGAHLHLLQVTMGEDDLITGLVTHDRPALPDGDRIIGCFLNTVPVRLNLGRIGTGAELARQVQAFLAAEKPHEIPLVDIAGLVGARGSAANPLFDTIFNFMDFHVMAGVDNNLLFRSALSDSLPEEYRFGAHEMTNTLFDVEVSATRGESFVSIKYSPRHFEAADIDRATGLFLRILERLVGDPGARLAAGELLSPAERDEILVRFNATATPYDEHLPLHGLFELQAAAVAAVGERTAVICGEERLGYAELERQAGRWARLLAGRGVRRHDSVGVVFERSVDLVAALFAILKAGAAYVPMEPDYPAARKGYIVQQSGVRLILADRRYELEPAPAADLFVVPAEEKTAAGPAAAPAVATEPADLAYTIYTSGSTGRPKGVMIEHRSAVNLIQWVNRELAVGAGDVLLMVSSVCFDLSVYDVFGGLGAGATVVTARPEELRDPARLMALVTEQAITFWSSVPSTMGHLVQYLEENVPGYRQEHLRAVFLSGDWIPLALPPKIRRFFPNARVISLGGATEATVWSNFFPIGEIAPWWVSIPYGRPLQNSAFYILDRRLEPVPPGVVGDLYIGGVGVARGYAGDPEKTAASFMPDPFRAEDGARMYRTGDLGRMTADRQMEFLGRSDHQVKIRGFRVELGEVESQLLRHPGVRDAVVVDRNDSTGGKYLCAYVVSPDQVPMADLRDHLATTLPEYMVPATFVYLPALPLTANGKVDRRALPEPSLESLGTSAEYVPPADETEAALIEIWEEVLGVSGIGTRHDFFELGGHSLSAVHVVTRIRRRFGVDFPLRTFFETTNIAGLAARIAWLLAGDGAGAQRGRWAPADGEDPTRPPMTAAQERFWFLQQVNPRSSAFNMEVSVRLTGRLDVAALAAALDELWRRHDALRANFPVADGRPVQVIAPPGRVIMPLVDLAELEPEARSRELHGLAERLIARPFDLERDPLLRTTLMRLAPDEHAAVLTVHHIVGDGWSVGILCRELADLYGAFAGGLPSPLPELPVRYGDYVRWQRRQSTGEALERQLAYWRRQLGGTLPVLHLPMQKQRPENPAFAGASVRFRFGAALTHAIEALSQQEGTSVFMTMLAAFKALLFLYTGQDDLVIGTNSANRNEDEAEGLVGSFVNNLVLRTRFTGDPTFRELLEKVRTVALEAYRHQDVPFEVLLEELRPDRAGGYAPLFQVMFVFQNFPMEPRELPGLRMSGLDVQLQTANFDLVMMLTEGTDAVDGSLIYDAELFEPSAVTRMLEHYQRLLETVVADPDCRLSDIPMVHQLEAQQLASSFSEDF